MAIPNYSRIKLLTDYYQGYGVAKGAVGYIVEVCDDGDYEVEFSEANGTTVAQFAVRGDEIEAAEADQCITNVEDFAA